MESAGVRYLRTSCWRIRSRTSEGCQWDLLIQNNECVNTVQNRSVWYSVYISVWAQVIFFFRAKLGAKSLAKATLKYCFSSAVCSSDATKWVSIEFLINTALPAWNSVYGQNSWAKPLKMLILRERLTIGVVAQLTTQWPVFFMVRGSTPAGGKFFLVVLFCFSVAYFWHCLGK